MSRHSGAVTVAWLVLTVPFVTSAALPYWDAVGVVPLLQALGVLAAIAGVVGTLISGILRRWAFALVWLAATVAWAWPQWAPAWPDPAADGVELSVFSANVLASGVEVQDLTDAIAAADADVAVLLEANPEYVDAVSSRLGERGFQVAARPTDGGVVGSAILTRLPAAPAGSIGGGFEQPVVRVGVGESAVTVAAIHPLPPSPGQVSLANVLAGNERWREGLREIRAWLDAQPTDERLILAGDFNSSTLHPAFRQVRAGLSDATPRRFAAYVPTWPRGSWLPAFTSIDHVLVRGATPLSSATVGLAGTDHASLLVVVSLDR